MCRLVNGRTVLANVRPIGRADSRRWIISVTDVTAQVQSDTAIKALSDEKVFESKRLLEEAEDRRRIAVAQKEQQALLVDVVSHELRNGISPILHSAMFVRDSLLELVKNKNLSGDSLALLRDDLEACDAIVDGANQMERVANDVLVRGSREFRYRLLLLGCCD